MNFFNLIHISFGTRETKEYELHAIVKATHKVIKNAESHVESNQIGDALTILMLKKANYQLVEYFRKYEDSK